MNLKIGIVGLPNVGKSTLFNALTKSSQAAAENFPFCTIDPNVGIVEVPDERIDKLVEIVEPKKVQRSSVEFVDIAGLVEGASKGEGLGNKFLSHIRECHAIAHVVRAFEDTEVHHVSGNVDPKRDLDIILTELILADLESVQKQISRVEKKAKSGDKESKVALEYLEQAEELLAEGRMVLEIVDEENEFFLKQFLTAKKFFVVANVREDELVSFDAEAFKVKLGLDCQIVPVCAKIEAELAELSEEEGKEFLAEIGAKTSGLVSLVKGAFELLGLENYFTAGVQEVRSWTIRKGDKAPQAAGAIHGDFEKGFIMADVIAYEDFVSCGGEAKAKEAGKMRMEGKEYVVQDGDVMHFKFNV
ncbi:MAG: redox-regulated ATPase YchF [Candidatus Peregrinibacteria bacterium]|nr:redox-regulated ATPase YchF [Candidatus Peregrinibacteria bacterium]